MRPSPRGRGHSAGDVPVVLAFIDGGRDYWLPYGFLRNVQRVATGFKGRATDAPCRSWPTYQQADPAYRGIWLASNDETLTSNRP